MSKIILSKLLNTTSTVLLSGIVLGSFLNMPSWSMDIDPPAKSEDEKGSSTLRIISHADEAKALQQSHPHITHIIIKGNGELDNADTPPLEMAGYAPAFEDLLRKGLLDQYPNLKSLDIIGGGGYAVETSDPRIIYRLAHNTSLTRLTWNSCSPATDQIDWIFRALVENTTLKSLSICDSFDTSFNQSSFDALATGLRLNTALSELNLKNNGIYGGKLNFKPLADSLKFNTTLTLLNLEGNSLHKVDVVSDRVSSQAVDALQEVRNVNENLRITWQTTPQL